MEESKIRQILEKLVKARSKTYPPRPFTQQQEEEYRKYYYEHDDYMDDDDIDMGLGYEIENIDNKPEGFDEWLDYVDYSSCDEQRIWEILDEVDNLEDLADVISKEDLGIDDDALATISLAGRFPDNFPSELDIELFKSNLNGILDDLAKVSQDFAEHYYMLIRRCGHYINNKEVLFDIKDLHSNQKRDTYQAITSAFGECFAKLDISVDKLPSIVLNDGVFIYEYLNNLPQTTKLTTEQKKICQKCVDFIMEIQKKLDKETKKSINPNDIEQATDEITTDDFKKATNTIKETARGEKQASKDTLSFDEE